MRYRAIKGVEKSALDALAAPLPGGQTQQRALGISDDFLDIPAISTDGDDIAGGKLWCWHRTRGARRVPGASGASGPKNGDRCAKVSVGRVEKFDHERVCIEHFLHHPALDADAATVNQSHLAQPRGVRGTHVLVDHRSDIRGQERVEVEASFDRDSRSAP